MDSEIIKHKSATGDLKEIHNKYIKSRNILNKYTQEDLKHINKIDLYFMMDLDEYRDKEIPKNVLEHVTKIKKRQYHPDISKGPREAFLLVSVARNILGDKRLRDIYDSSFFHVELPEDRIYQEDEFFSAFGKCFNEYAKFSMVQPAPLLTKENDTAMFYEFWRNYKSNRIYIPIDEYYNLSKEDRSEYTRANQEKLIKLKNNDILKLRELVKLSYKRDPRIRSISEQLEELRIKEKNEWKPEEIAILKRFCTLFSKTKKNKWEIITEKLVSSTKIKRSVKEVLEKVDELKIKR